MMIEATIEAMPFRLVEGSFRRRFREHLEEHHAEILEMLETASTPHCAAWSRQTTTTDDTMCLDDESSDYLCEMCERFIGEELDDLILQAILASSYESKRFYISDLFRYADDVFFERFCIDTSQIGETDHGIHAVWESIDAVLWSHFYYIATQVTREFVTAFDSENGENGEKSEVNNGRNAGYRDR